MTMFLWICDDWHEVLLCIYNTLLHVYGGLSYTSDKNIPPQCAYSYTKASVPAKEKKKKKKVIKKRYSKLGIIFSLKFNIHAYTALPPNNVQSVQCFQ